MSIVEALKEKRAELKAVCEDGIEDCIESGEFSFTIFAISIEEGKMYKDCLLEINQEMKGSGYHLKFESKEREKDAQFTVYVEAD